MTDTEHAKNLVENPSWKWAKEKLQSQVSALMLITTLPSGVTATALEKEILVRKKAIALVSSWLSEIEGDSEVPEILDESENLITRF